MPFRLSEEEDQQLVSELAAALEQVVDQSCMEMSPLWLAATQRARAELARTEMAMPFEPSRRYLALGRPSRSKYRSLAVFRHAVIWKQVLPKLSDSRQREALKVVYFTPFPDNVPPYAWSKAAAKAPGVKGFGGPRLLKALARSGAEEAVLTLCEEMDALDQQQVLGELVFRLLKPAVTTTACDVLKLERSQSYGMTK
ncbi:MAG: hypothetical protein VX899_09985 [Myxococcota bacterium]|nr:hypothetical protein [Myxococcota bacterium]